MQYISDSKRYPRVLVVALGRINARDSYNNGLLLRNLFGERWPRHRLAQIFSSGDTGDHGFFGHYYCIGARDRVLGGLFYRLKPTARVENGSVARSDSIGHRTTIRGVVKRALKSLVIDSGVYELIFRPKLSQEMLAWVKDFQPDVILAQGYNLTFSWLPIMLKEQTGAKLAVLTTDDWPKYLYSGLLGETTLFKWLVRPFVIRAARDLFAQSDIPCAFGHPMAREYMRRYGKNFVTFDHTDDPQRFHNALPISGNSKSTFKIVAIGTFNEYRLPLLFDVDAACEELNRKGLDIRIAVFSSAYKWPSQEEGRTLRHTDFYPDPGHDDLPGYLKGADVLFLAEGFDEGFVSAIELSVSSKSHLFMFSKKPILVYGAEKTGVVQYAKSLGWASVVERRSVEALVVALEEIILYEEKSRLLVENAWAVAEERHTRFANQERFLNALSMHPV